MAQIFSFPWFLKTPVSQNEGLHWNRRISIEISDGTFKQKP
jgi:hypothetical protein